MLEAVHLSDICLTFYESLRLISFHLIDKITIDLWWQVATRFHLNRIEVLTIESNSQQVLQNTSSIVSSYLFYNLIGFQKIVFQYESGSYFTHIIIYIITSYFGEAEYKIKFGLLLELLTQNKIITIQVW